MDRRPICAGGGVRAVRRPQVCRSSLPSAASALGAPCHVVAPSPRFVAPTLVTCNCRTMQLGQPEPGLGADERGQGSEVGAWLRLLRRPGNQQPAVQDVAGIRSSKPARISATGVIPSGKCGMNTSTWSVFSQRNSPPGPDQDLAAVGRSCHGKFAPAGCRCTWLMMTK